MGKKCSGWTTIFTRGLFDRWLKSENWRGLHSASKQLTPHSFVAQTLRQPELHLVMVKSTWFLFFWCLKTQSLKRISTKEHFSSNTKRHLITVSQMKGDLIVSPEGRSSNELPTGLVTIHQHLLLSAVMTLSGCDCFSLTDSKSWLWNIEHRNIVPDWPSPGLQLSCSAGVWWLSECHNDRVCDRASGWAWKNEILPPVITAGLLLL